MQNENQVLGSAGEKAAARFLKKKGYKILAKNHRNFFGEIDIIACQHKTYVFVEVKTRSTIFLAGSEAVNHKKQQNIIASAESFLDKEKLFEVDYRFDIIEVIATDGKIMEINHIIDAFA